VREAALPVYFPILKSSLQNPPTLSTKIVYQRKALLDSGPDPPVQNMLCRREALRKKESSREERC